MVMHVIQVLRIRLRQTDEISPSDVRCVQIIDGNSRRALSGRTTVIRHPGNDLSMEGREKRTRELGISRLVFEQSWTQLSNLIQC